MGRKAFWALPFAASLALTGCSGLFGSEPGPGTPDASGEQGVSGTAATEPESDSGPADSSSEDEENGFGDSAANPGGSHGVNPFEASATAAKPLTAQQLSGVAQAIETDDPREGTKIGNDAELKGSMGHVGALLESMDITPATCGAFVASGLTENLTHVNLAAMAIPGDASARSISVSLGSYDDPADVAVALSKTKTKASAVDCSEFMVTLHGQDASARVEVRRASTNATKTLASLSTVEFAGKSEKTLTVIGFDGYNTVGINVVDPKDLSISAAQAEDLIDLALLHMSGQ